MCRPTGLVFGSTGFPSACALGYSRSPYRAEYNSPSAKCLHPVVKKDVRQAIVAKYPYFVYYREDDQSILVISILHTSRNPEIWCRRGSKRFASAHSADRSLQLPSN